jgi:hypothetical protein
VRILHALLLAIGLAIVCRPALGDNEWPGPDVVIAQETISPNGRYAIVVPTAETALDKGETTANQLADVTAHRLLGKIPETDYWAHKNNCALTTWWAPDSSWCAVAYFNRLGFDECVVIDIAGDSFRAIEIGKQIHGALEAAIRKQLRHPLPDRGEGLRVRPRPDRTLLVRALATTNPKGVPGDETHDAFLSGSYDLATNKWTKLNTRPLDPKLNMMAACDSTEGELVRLTPDRNAPWPSDFYGEFAANEAERAKVLDRLLNETYAAVRIFVPPARFAKIKEDQKAWLATWVEQKSQQEKNTMTNARIHQLRAILWEE